MYRHHNLAKRRCVLLAALVYNATRALAYVPSIRRAPIQDPIWAIAAGRTWVLWCYITAWGLAALLCALSLRRGRLLYPLAVTCGLMGCWGWAWLIGWLRHPGTTWWQTAITYWGPMAMIGFLVALTPRMPRESRE